MMRTLQTHQKTLGVLGGCYGGLFWVGSCCKWLRGLDLNQRPLGYERPEISASIGQQGTSGYPETPLGTTGNAYRGLYGD
jgi:hypothetical protein